LAGGGKASDLGATGVVRRTRRSRSRTVMPYGGLTLHAGGGVPQAKRFSIRHF
jgi:hypothetical protein